MNPRDNIYAQTRSRVISAFGDRVDGNAAGLVLVIYTSPLSDAARNALEKSFAAIGYEPEACLFARVGELAVDSVFDLVEGIDPLALVATDEQAAKLYEQAVRQAFPTMRSIRIFGRAACAFPELNPLMQTEAGKQAVWHLLKTLA